MSAASALDRFYASSRKRTKDGRLREIDWTASISRPAAEYIVATLRNLRPARAIEIGMAWGASSVAICAEMAERGSGHLTIVDPYQESVYEGVGRVALEELGLAGHASLRCERSDLFLPTLVATPVEPIDFAFVDGDHRVDAVFVDVYYLDRLLRPGGILMLDDVQFSSVSSVVRYLLRTFHYVELPCDQSRFAALRKIAGDDRDWADYGEL